MAIAPNTIYDTFSRTLSGRWGQADSGASWTTPNNNGFGVGSGFARYSAAPNSSTVMAYCDLGAIGVPKQDADEVLVRVSWTGSATYPLTDFGPTLSNSGGNTGYYASLQGNWSEISIGVYIDGYRWELNRGTGSLLKNKTYWVRFRRTSAGLYLKVWEEGRVEPSSWSLTSGLWDGSKKVGVGSPGMFAKGTRDSVEYRVHDMIYYTMEDSYRAGEVSDTFNRTVMNAWGVSSSGHIWEGAVSADPQAFAESYASSVSTTDAGLGILTANWEEKIAIIGASRTGDAETTAKILLTSGSDKAQVRVGLRGARRYINNRMSPTGYMLQIEEGNDSLVVYKRTGSIVAWQVVAGGKTTEAFIPNKKYNVRFQAKGTTLKAKAWPDGAAEPGWQVVATDSSISSGTGYIGVSASTATPRAAHIYDFTHGIPLADVVPPGEVTPPKNYTTPGLLQVVPNTTTDTSQKWRVTYTDDENKNVTITPTWRRIGTNTWSSSVSGLVHNRTTRTCEFSIVDLTKNTNYEVRVTFSDPDGVKNTQTLSTTFSTAALGVEAGAARILSISQTQATVEAGYKLDLDHTSTAVLSSRKMSQSVYTVEDYFIDSIDATTLQNARSARGGDWIRHPASSMGAEAIFFKQGYYTTRLSGTAKTLYYHTNVAPSSEYTSNATILLNTAVNSIGVAGRVNTELETYYGAGYDVVTNSWELFKMVSGTKTVLGAVPFNSTTNVIHEISLEITDMRKTFFLGKEAIITTTDNSITSGHPGYYTNDVNTTDVEIQTTLRSFLSHYRSVLGAWKSHGNMTPNRALEKFLGTATGLELDTMYQFKVDFYDTSPNGANTGTNPALVSGMTTGRAASLFMVRAKTTFNSAVVSTNIEYDTNRNSRLNLQYKSTTSKVWNTVSFQKMTKYRDSGRFDMTLAGLMPSTTYQIKVEIEDPDGLIAGSPKELYALFTTKGYIPEGSEEEKKYVWKVYNRDNKYLTTISDAPMPKFSMHENGGTTDLELNLYRSYAEMVDTKIIDFHHRIDVWAIDPNSKGLGPNLITDPDMGEGGWVIQPAGSSVSTPVNIDQTGGPDGGPAMKISAPSTYTEIPHLSNPIHVDEEVPLHISCLARAIGSKLRLYVRAYNVNHQGFDMSSETAETVGTEWQRLSINYTPPRGTEYIRVIVENDSRGEMWADKFDVRAKEIKIYSGNIEAFTPKIDRNGETVSIQVLGLSAFLSDDYIEFLQFVDSQPHKDVKAGRNNHGASDPAEMVKKIIDEARKTNPRCPLYYTSESIKNTGSLMQYTFRDVQIRHALDKARDLCPAGWHYFIEADGLVHLRGPQHAATHLLRIGVEITDFEVEKSIRNLKNYIRVKGRQDEDKTEAGSEGTISYVTFDQASIDKFGKRVTVFNDSQLIDHESAKIVGDGRLEELNKEEQRVRCTVPDEKLINAPTGSLLGYNIESFRPGDNIIVIDPLSGPRYSFWNTMVWNINNWDLNDVFAPIPAGVPIKTINYKGDEVELELSERPPSQVGDYAKLYKWIALKDKE